MSRPGVSIALDTRMPLLFPAFRREATRAREALSSARHAAGGLAAACRRPIQVAFFDAMLASGLADYHAKLQAARPQVVVVYEDNYNFLSKMCLGRMRDACCEMIASAGPAAPAFSPRALMPRTRPTVSRGGRGRRAARVRGSRRCWPSWTASVATSRCRSRGSSPGCPTSAQRSTGARLRSSPAAPLPARAAEARCPRSHRHRRVSRCLARCARLFQPQHGRIARLLVPP